MEDINSTEVLLTASVTMLPNITEKVIINEALPMAISNYPSIYIMATTFLVIIIIFLLHKRSFQELCWKCRKGECSNLRTPQTLSISDPRLLTPEEVRTNIPRFSEFFRAESSDEGEDDVFETIPMDTISPSSSEADTTYTFSGSRRLNKTDSITESADDIIFDNSMVVGTSGMQ